MRTILVVASFTCGALLTAQASPYAELSARPIKSLSAEQIEAYLTGAGSGFALAAELNRYPGPKHVLELAEKLTLNEEQLQSVQQIFDDMQSNAISLGEMIVALEGELDEAFRSEAIDDEQLESLTRRIGTLQGELRQVHLRAHLATREVLTRHQRMLYEQLRGYGGKHHHNH